MTLEDFRTYTEVDPLNNITRTATRVTVDALRSSRIAHVYKDYGVDYFNGHFRHHINVDETLFGSGLRINMWMLSNNIGTIKHHQDNDYDYIAVTLQRTSSTYTKIRIGEFYDGAYYESDYYDMYRYWTYYLIIDRIGPTFRLRIYSNSARTTLLDTFTITLKAVVDYRYLYPICNAGSGSDYNSCHIESLEFVGVIGGGFGAQITNDSDSLDLNPITWKESQECDVAIRPVPLRSGPKVDTSHWMLDTREITFRVRLSDAEKTMLQTIFDANELVTIIMNTGWVYNGWLRGKLVKYEYRVVDGTLRPWLYELKLDCITFTYS